MAEEGLAATPGTYVLVFRSPRPVGFRAGRLGPVSLPAGWLMYVGSARGPGGLAARVGRHLTAGGRPRWHVDFLVRALPPVEAWVVPGDAPREADWVAALGGMPTVRPVAPGFGASDSRAVTHLFHSARRPSFAAFRRRLARAWPADPPPRRIAAGAALRAEPLESLKNLGPASSAWLREAGIHSREELVRLGPVEAFRRVQATGRRASLNLLYAMAGALENCRWDRLPEGVRGALLMELDARAAAEREEPWPGR